mgnify:CR=1 FL=1|jgi:hypothetical protein
MAERLVILSDLWGAKKGLWITSYLGYLQQYFDIVYYDTSQLADLDAGLTSAEDLCTAFDNGGLERAVRNLMAKESTPGHYLTFCAGGTVVWNAAKEGLPVESLYAVSPLNMHRETDVPDCQLTLVYGEYMDNRPSKDWALNMGAPMEIIPRFGREMYSDEKIIQKVCKDLLDEALRKQYQGL